MSWQTDSGDHEGWVAKVLADGRISGATTGTGVIVEATDADIAAGYEIRRLSSSVEAVVPWDQVATWRVVCTCGWAGTEMPAYADDAYGFRDCPETVEDGFFYPQWQTHVAPLQALGGLRDLARRARALDGELAEQVRLARTAGASWSQIGHQVGLSKQGAQQRWAAT